MYLKDKVPSVRAMVIQAIRYTLPDVDEAFDAVLKTLLIDMLITMMDDPELENRRLALTTLNSAAHNKPDLILPHLGQLLPLVMRESVIKPELVREVMMGPFKHKVDDGLEVRKVRYIVHLRRHRLTQNRAPMRPCIRSWKPHSPVSISSTFMTASSPASATNTTSEHSAI